MRVWTGKYWMTEEHAQKISKKLTGRKISEETRKKMSQSKMGHSVTYKTRKKLSLSKMGDKNPAKKEETRRKIGLANKGENSHRWKGDKVGYDGIHSWVKWWKKRTWICSVCGKHSDRIEMANIDHKYRRVLDDYTEMCPKCHRKYDKEYNNYSNRRKK